MACDTGLLDGLFDDMDDDEDWTSTDWSEEIPAAAYNGHTETKNSAQDAKTRLLSFACKKTERSAEPREQTQGGPVVQRMLLNDNKAGMEGLDKDRINQIIHEASKGSKFYENERLKEEQMKKRIEEQKKKIQEISAEQLRQGTIEADRLLEDFEQQRDLSRTVVHIDMDAFYAAVEMRDNPSLKTKPMAVGGNSMLSTSNYHARKFGVRAAMPGFIGKKLCPELVIVPLNFEKYTAVSKQVKAIMSEYDPNFCPMSLDEAYLDLTEHLQNRKDMSEDERTYICRDSQYADSRAHCKCDLTEIARNYGSDTIKKDGLNLNEYFSKNHHFETVSVSVSSLDENTDYDKIDKNVVTCPVCKKMLPPFKHVTFGLSDEDAVHEMRSRIEQKTTLTASAGIAPNMMLAKVCSDKNKPNGQYKIKSTYEDVMDFIRDLPTRKISGIGKVSEAMLNAVGVYTCTDLYEKRGLLYHLYSPISFNYFMRICLGIGSTTVERDSERKSMSTERTFSELSLPADLYQKCEELCESLAEDLKSEQLKGKTVSIKIKTVKFEVRTRAHTVKDYTNEYEDILRSAMELLRTEIQNCSPHPLRLRLMGVRMSNLLHESHCQGKKQNTIIGAFKRLTKLSSEKESKSEIGGSGISNVNNDETKVLNSVKIDEIDVSVTEVKPAISSKITDWKSALDKLGEGFTNETVTSPKIQHPLSIEPELVNVQMPEKSGVVFGNEKGFSKIKENIGNEKEVNPNTPEKSDLKVLDKVYDVGGKEVKGSSDEIENTDPYDERSKTKMLNDTDIETKVDIGAGNSTSENKVNVSDGNSINVKEVNNASENNVFQKEDNAHVGLENPNSFEKENPSVFSPSLRKTRSGLIRTPVSQSRRKNKRVRNKQKAEESVVTYTCPVCALNIQCESLQTFNEHVDMCLENREHVNLGCISTVRLNVKAQRDIKNETHGSCNSTLGVNLTNETCIVKAHGETDDNSESSVTRENILSYDENLDDEKSKIAEIEESCSKEQQCENVKITSKIERSSLEDTIEIDTCTNSEKESQPALCSGLKKQNSNKIYTENMRSDSKYSDVSVSKMYFKRVTNTDTKCDTAESNKPTLEDTGGCDKDVNIETKFEPKLEEIKTMIGHTDALEVKKFDISESSDEVRENKVEYKDEIDNSICVESEVKEYEDKSKDNKVGHKTELPQLPEIRDLSDTEYSSETKDKYLTQIPLSLNIKNCTESPKNSISRYRLDHVDKSSVLGKQEMSEKSYPVLTTVGVELLKTSHVRQNDVDCSDEIEGLNEEDSANGMEGDDDDKAVGALLVCPVCNLEQRSASLNEFNSHVDACLSRGTISQILKEQNKQENGGIKRSRALTPGSSKSAKRRKTTMPGSSKPCRSIASFFMEK